MQLRDPALETKLRGDATKALRELRSYYASTQLVQPERLVRKAEALLAFIKDVR